MLLVRFVRLVQNGSMQCVTQTLACLRVCPNHDMRRFVAGFRELRPQRCYVDIVISTDITVSVMKLSYKVHRPFPFGALVHHATKAVSFVLNCLRRDDYWLSLKTTT